MPRKLPVDKIGELAFNIIQTSEEIENYVLNKHVVKSRTYRNDTSFFKHIDKDIVLLFLSSPDTKLKVVINDDGKAIIIAHNIISDETIEIDGLGDHFLALVKTVSHAKEKIEELQQNPEAKLIDGPFIKEINKRLQYLRREEPGIGEYRYRDLAGGQNQVYVTIRDDETGRGKPSKCLIPENSVNHNIKRKMNKLIDWVNNVAFRDGRDIMNDIAEFHARFVQIHPFSDGNGRTARLLTNYLLLLNNLPIITIPPESKDEYIAYLDYAVAPSEIVYRNECKFFKEMHEKIYSEQGPRTESNRYAPLKRFFENFRTNHSVNDVINNILNYESQGKFRGHQIDNENPSAEV